MFITRTALPRRTVIRGLGATLALPFLDAMVPALSPAARAATGPVRRLGFVYMPNGVAMNVHRFPDVNYHGYPSINYWTPKGQGRDFEFSPILTPLSPFRERLLVISGLAHPHAETGNDGASGDHTRATSTWLTGVYPKRTEGADVRNSISADQLAAAVLGKETALRSLELAIDLNYLAGMCENSYNCAYVNTLAWSSPTTPLPTENNPRMVFERLFGDGGTPGQRAGQARQDRSILDAVAEQFARLRRTLGPTDRSAVGDYLDAVREAERRIQGVEGRADTELPALERPRGIPERFDEHVKLMYELQWLAFRADLTRVVTFMLGRELNFRTYPEIGITQGHHGLSHHADRPDQIELYSKLGIYQAQLFAWFLQKMQETPDGDGSLLDHSLFLYGAGLSDPHRHAHTNLPLAVVGGRGLLDGGRHVVFPEGTPVANLLLSLLDKVGVRADTLGDSSGRVPLEPLAGV